MNHVLVCYFSNCLFNLLASMIKLFTISFRRSLLRDLHDEKYRIKCNSITLPQTHKNGIIKIFIKSRYRNNDA